MFLTVKRAFIVLDANGVSNLHIEFDQDESAIVTTSLNRDYAKGETFYKDSGRGLVDFGVVDDNGKFWSSRPGVFNTEDGTIACMDAVEFQITKGAWLIGPSQFATHITVGFAKHILEKFNLPFHVEKVTYPTSTGKHEISYNFVQNTVDPVGEETIRDHVLGEYGNEAFTICREDGSMESATFKSNPEYYKGLSWPDFLSEVCFREQEH